MGDRARRQSSSTTPATIICWWTPTSSDLKLDAPLPATDKILHFGKGQTETTLTLPPGKHTLELLFADYQHMSFDPPLHSQKITITVEWSPSCGRFCTWTWMHSMRPSKSGIVRN